MLRAATVLAVELGLFSVAVPALGGEATGRVTGELRFPSCTQTAPGLEVCAESESGDTICTSDFVAVRGALTYTLELTPGRYFVFARTPMIDHRAYYSQAVLCGLGSSCDQHDPIEVLVEPGATAAGVHPADWLRPEPKPAVATALTN